MCHRIAELMRESEKARTKAARTAAANECAELILRLWEKRSAWPRGWPPASAASLLTKLADLDSHRWPRERGDEDREAESWLETFPLLQELQASEISIWREAALAEIDVEDASEWLMNHGNQMEEEERETLEMIVRMAESSAERLEWSASMRGKKKATKGSDFAARLRKLSAERARLVQRAKRAHKPTNSAQESREKSLARRRSSTSD